jgi:uncharacterized phage protein gp47/JayE
MSSDLLDSSGLSVKTRSDIVGDLNSGFQGIYGDDINIDQNSPDGQVIGIFAQEGVDLRELLVSINASFDPDQAVGIQLDQRCAINGVTRVAGTYSIFPIDVTVSKTVTLDGLDEDFNSADGVGFTIQDNSGNEFILIDTFEFTIGTTTKNFRAKEIGSVTATTGTITTPVTIIDGVTSVNNSSAAIYTGQDEETDVQLRVRRARSVAITSTGYLNGLRAALLDLDGVTAAECYENTGDTVDSNGIPAHGLWCIVEGGANSDITDIIYQKNSAGTPTKGSVTVTKTNSNGILVPINFDRPTSEDLHLQFEIKRTVSGFSFDTDAIKAYIAANLTYEVGAYAETSEATCISALAINSLGGGGVPINMEISNDGATWVDYLDPSGLDYQFTISTANIDITVV